MKIFKTMLPEIKLKYENKQENKIKISKSYDAYDLLMKLYDPDTIEYTETVIVLFMNRANNTLGWFKVSSGCTSCAIVDSKVLFATALKCGASSFILSHNHPSGAKYPSKEDTLLTQKILEGSKFLDVKLLDHLIITKEGYYSFADEGMLN